MRKLLSAILLLLPLFGKTQSENNEKAQISVITVEPWGREVHALFGHSAIRVNDSSEGYDYVFSYGVFGFDSPESVVKFIKGEADYMLEAVEYDGFEAEYRKRGANIHWQVLKLKDEEVTKIRNYLETNMLPENRKYRYNTFYDNCATKINEVLEKNIDGEITYPRELIDVRTYRSMVGKCLVDRPWLKFGIDLLLGSDADDKLYPQRQLFLPERQCEILEECNVLKGMEQRRLLKDSGAVEQLDESNEEASNEEALNNEEASNEEEQYLLEDSGAIAAPFSNEEPAETKSLFDSLHVPKYLCSPTAAAFIFLISSLIITYIQYRKGKIRLGATFDFILFFIIGTIGSLLTYMIVFSKHPCVFPNWNIFWTNPLQLAFSFVLLFRLSPKLLIGYLFANVAALAFFLSMLMWMNQIIEPEFVLLTLTMIIRSGWNICYQLLIKN